MKHLNLTAEKVKNLCIKNHWCTVMDCCCYRFFLQQIDKWNDGTGIGKARLAYIAKGIKMNSDTSSSMEEIADLLKNAGKIEEVQTIPAEVEEKPKPVNLKCNSVQARKNVQQYIANNFDPSNYNIPYCKSFTDIALKIWEIFNVENPRKYNPGKSDYYRFREWCSGLPSILDCCYYYNRSAVTDVANLLQQTPEKAAKYTETAAEEFLTQLIYREIIRVVEVY